MNNEEAKEVAEALRKALDAFLNTILQDETGRQESLRIELQSLLWDNKVGIMHVLAAFGEQRAPDVDAALRRGIQMLHLGKNGEMLSFQNDEVEALLKALPAAA